MIKPMAQIERLRQTINRLPLKERAQLIQKIERDYWKHRFPKIFSPTDTRLKKIPLSHQEIVRIVKKVRKQRHARRGH